MSRISEGARDFLSRPPLFRASFPISPSLSFSFSYPSLLPLLFAFKVKKLAFDIANCVSSLDLAKCHVTSSLVSRRCVFLSSRISADIFENIIHPTISYRSRTLCCREAASRARARDNLYATFRTNQYSHNIAIKYQCNAIQIFSASEFNRATHIYIHTRPRNIMAFPRKRKVQRIFFHGYRPTVIYANTRREGGNTICVDMGITFVGR